MQSPENLDRLRRGMPVKVNLRDLGGDGGDTGLPDIDVVVFYADAASLAEL